MRDGNNTTDISEYTAGTGNVVTIRIIIFILGRGGFARSENGCEFQSTMVCGKKEYL